MAKITNEAGYPIPDGTAPAIISIDTHEAGHPKPAAGGGGK